MYICCMEILTGHLTSGNKKAIKAILEQKLFAAKVGKTSYFISFTNGIYEVLMKIKDRGMIPCPGSELRVSTYKATFTL